MNYSDTDEAKRVRRARQTAQKGQQRDPLAERARLVAFWKACATTNKGYLPHNGCWWHVFTWQPHWRWLLMPRLRARQDARDRAHEAAYQAELRASVERWRQKKAEKAAALARQRSPQQELY